MMRAEAGAQLAHPFHDGREIDLDGRTHPHSEWTCLLGIEHGAPGADDGFGGNATHVEAVPAQEMLLDQGHFCPETGCAGSRYQPSSSSADDDEIIARRRGRVLPIRRVDIGDEARIVRIRRVDQDRLRAGAHKVYGFWPGSLALIFFARALRAKRVTKTVTTTVASRPTPYKTHSPVVRWRCPALRLTSEPR